MFRFVVLHHLTPPGSPRGPHWDLMLERDGVLETWALDAPPLSETSQDAQKLDDHRVHYLDYEGPVSGDRGVVQRWDWGTYLLHDSHPGFRDVRLVGQRLTTRLVLRRGPNETDRWSAHATDTE
ncbi:MAG: hypothetical protein CMJ59_08175 [Planctomycetaceae bacterium]|nr:hypothetical protein [Planctomycetaceae bacterium]